MPNRVTRLAPSPTGTLHLGNLRTFLVTWAIARQNGWRIVMRIEDLDAQRIRPGAAAELLDLLAWIGIEFDEGPHVQSRDREPYRAAMRQLASAGVAYACSLSRREIRLAASAPHATDGELQFPRALRSARPADYAFDREDANYRLIVSEESITIHDHVAGDSDHRPCDEVGDFVIWTSRGVPSYQLAVVVDDMRQGVTDVVRGDDLLSSAARQTLLYRALGHPPPEWWHLPLVNGPEGRRLAKRDNIMHVSAYRDAGASPQRIIGLLATWCGVSDCRAEMDLHDFLPAFRIDTLPRSPITLTPSDLQWLLQQA